MVRRLCRWLTLVLRVAAFIALLPWAFVVGLALLTPLPPELAAERPAPVSTEIVDRGGFALREIRAAGGARASWVGLDEVSPRALEALIAAEDRRFGWHPGVDPLAIVRATAQLVARGAVVSGASTLTQQLARTVVARPRTAWGKITEMALALRIEASLSKREVMEQYVNRVAFGPNLRGIEAASRAFFDKPARDLSLAEAASLAAMPRGPARYDPRESPDRLVRRRDWILDRMVVLRSADGDEVARAKAEALTPVARRGSFHAPHFVEAVLSGALEPERGALRDLARVVTTLDGAVQRELEVLVERTVAGFAGRAVTAAAAVVLKNDTGEILAYVGSPGLDAPGGHNDGVLALRQPGSALKPFVYAAAMERLGWSASTVLPDVELSFDDGAGGRYAPKNYDGRFHGPVRLREALANSYNVPAVWAASAVGPARVLERLRAFGLDTLTESAGHYGVGLALGDGEVRLIDLANAYATLARGGVWRPVRAILESGEGGEPRPAKAPERRVIDERIAFVLTDVLSDAAARRASFGTGSALELDFPVAAKTGTSKGFRDNVAVGFTRDVTVAVWVGNFDGAPMMGVSGVTGAGPIFHDAMRAAARAYPPRPFVRPVGVVEGTVCALSGAGPRAACPHAVHEIFAGSAPSDRCGMHAEDGRETLPGLYAAWERGSARRGGEPPRQDLDEGPAREALAVIAPEDGARFVLDPALGAREAVRVRVLVPRRRSARLIVDGHPVPLVGTVADVPLARGEHRVLVEAGGEASEPVRFTVE